MIWSTEMEKPTRHIQYRAIPPADFAALGVQQLAYIKPIIVDVEKGSMSHGYAVCAADGTQMAVLPSREVAMAAVLQHDMEPVSVH
jgi:hypothetical protein